MRNVHEAPDQSLQANAKPTPAAKRTLLPTPPNEGRKKQRQELPEPETPEVSQTSDINNVGSKIDIAFIESFIFMKEYNISLQNISLGNSNGRQRYINRNEHPEQ